MTESTIFVSCDWFVGNSSLGYIVFNPKGLFSSIFVSGTVSVSVSEVDKISL